MKNFQEQSFNIKILCNNSKTRWDYFVKLAVLQENKQLTGAKNRLMRQLKMSSQL
ncbi:hypothetical protein BDFB_015183 [Asbolus verrucosus]|uniref:Uncharacterized protein n=1 Tax=Asbolus verrucosus TaxID=1661398 RepID=A0A482VZX3_ASBVE|nr:hypothetical protein BDFB_015183 [Asbolus verrucosus]